MMSGKWFKAIILLIVIGVALPVVVYQMPTVSASEIKATEPKYTSHEPICINGNLQFTPDTGVSSGNGTQNNPFIIENWDVNANTANGIEIRNTDVYFIIRNCCIHESERNYGIYFHNVTNSKIENCTIYNNEDGILLDSSSNNHISANQIYNNNGRGIWFHYVFYSGCTSVFNNTITDNQIYNNNGGGICLDYSSNNNNIISNQIYNNKNGICIMDSSNNNITANQIYNNYGHGINLNSFYSSSSNNIISSNLIYNNNGDRDSTGIYLSGIHLSSSSNNNITLNQIYNNSNGIHLYGSSNNVTSNQIYNNDFHGIVGGLNSVLRNNTLENNAYNLGIGGYQDIDTSNTINGKPIYYIIEQNDLVFDGIDVGYLGLVSCSNVVVKNLTLTNNYQGLLLINTSYSTITNCSVYDNFGCGISVSSSSNNQITNCNAYNNSYGIWLDYSSNNNIVTDCTVYNNSYGIQLYRSSNNNVVTDCTVYNNTGEGIHLYESASNNITNCAVYNNNNYGIKLSFSSNNNNITNCSIYNNYNGISLSGGINSVIYCKIANNANYGIDVGSNGNIIHHNNFINNGENAYDASTNYWDDGSEGNYWSDYYGEDTDSDGIGDWAKIIPGGANVDRYPLMNPVSMTFPIKVTLNSPSSVASSSIVLTWSQNNDNDFANYTICQSTVQNTLGNVIATIKDKTITSYNVTGLSPNTTYYFIIRVYNIYGLYSDSNQVSETTLMNHAPVVNSITANPTTVNPSGTVTITVNAADEDTGDVLTYVYSCTGGTISGTGNTVTWTAPYTTGSYTVSVYVNDGTANSNSKSVTVIVTTSETTTGTEKPEKEGGKGFIPGFETTSIILILGICLLLLKRRKKESC